MPAVPSIPTAHLAPDPTALSVKHWGRLLDGELLATTSRMDWALLLKRTFGFDALRCPKCHGTLRPIATIIEPATIRKILTHLAVRRDPLPQARARDPTGQTDFDFDAA